jgi:putative restriction endonuclease
VSRPFFRERGRVWYDDQREAHRQIYAGDATVEYAFMGADPTAADNRWLREAMEQQVLVIYFLGVSPGRYQPIVPTFVVGWYPDRLRVELTCGAIVGASAQALVPDAPERRYALREIKQRLHQAAFREAMLTACGRRCAISRLPEPKLLEAAYIVVRADEQLGQPVVTNGQIIAPVEALADKLRLKGGA